MVLVKPQLSSGLSCMMDKTTSDGAGQVGAMEMHS